MKTDKSARSPLCKIEVFIWLSAAEGALSGALGGGKQNHIGPLVHFCRRAAQAAARTYGSDPTSQVSSIMFYFEIL